MPRLMQGVVIAKLETDTDESSAALAGTSGSTRRAGRAAAFRRGATGGNGRGRRRGARGRRPAGRRPPGLRAVLQRARRSGGSLLGRTVALLGWLTGNQRRSADPAGYLRDWRRRGTLGRAVNPVHAALVEAAGRVPAGSRAAIVRALGTEELEPAVAAALDVVARDAVAEMRVPGSFLWPVIGIVQLAVGAAFLFAVAWYVTLFVAAEESRSRPSSCRCSDRYLSRSSCWRVRCSSARCSALLAAHAGWVGRRHGTRLAERVRGRGHRCGEARRLRRSRPGRGGSADDRPNDVDGSATPA